jgi:hypothetical protein
MSVTTKLHYFSRSELCYKEVKLYSLAIVVTCIMLFTSLLTMAITYFGIDPLGIANLHSSSIAKENSILKAHLASLDRKLEGFQSSMNNLVRSDDQLRTAVNLPPIPGDVRKVAVGGIEMNSDFGTSDNTNELISSATAALDILYRKAKLQEQSYENILKKCKTNQELFAHIPAIDPVRSGIQTDGFGMRIHPILHVRLMHEGLDIVANVGTDVYATGDGVVSYVGKRGGYGNVVEIDHGFGYSTLYGHLSKPLVGSGEKVKRGQVIALSGNTGLSTAPHLHYEVRKNGVHVDPAEYFFDTNAPCSLYKDQPRK